MRILCFLGMFVFSKKKCTSVRRYEVVKHRRSSEKDKQFATVVGTQMQDI